MEFLNNYNISDEIANYSKERMIFALSEKFKEDNFPINLFYDWQLLTESKIYRLELNTRKTSFLN